nr:MAG TPA: Protein of unknown function (DUF2497) [Caudoviricetes sp.]
MPIKIEITGDNAKAIMAEMFKLCSGVFAAYDNPPAPADVQAAGLAMQDAPATAPAPAPVPAPTPAPTQEPAKQDFVKGEPSPFMKFADTVVQCISEEQHTELKALSSKFLTADPGKHRPMLRKWFDDHNVKRLSELPAAKADEFKKWLEANMDAG